MTPTSRGNATLFRRFLTDVVACGETSATTDLVAAGAADHNLVFERTRRRETVTGPGRRALPGADVDLHAEGVVVSEDRVAVRGRVTGTHRESLMDLVPTGRSFETACAWFCRLENDRIAELRSLPDGLGLLTQLDAVPEEFPARSPPDSSQQQ